MHIPTIAEARQLHEGLDDERKAFAVALSRRYGALSQAQQADANLLKQVFMLELQARCSPDAAARIAYTSEDMLVPLALALVRARAESEARRIRMERIKVGLWVAAALSVVCLVVSLVVTHLNSEATPPPAPAPAGGASNGSSR